MHQAPNITDDSTPPLVGNDHLLRWCSSVHLYPADCYLDIPSRGIKAKLMVTTSNQVLVNMADLVGDLEIERDEMAANDLMRTATRLVVRVTRLLEHRHRRRVMQMLRPRSADVEELTTNHDHR